MRRPRTDIRPTFGNPNANSTTIQPFPQPSTNRFPPPTRTQPTATQPQPFHNHFPNYPATAFQPRTNYREPQPVHNRPSTATQPRANHNHASIVFQSHSSRPKPSDGRSRAWQTPTTQPSFGSNTKTTRFRLNLPTSLIRQLQPLLINNSTSTTPRPRHNRPYPVLIKPFISPSNLNHQFNLDHQTKRRARPEDRALRFSHNRVIGTHTVMHTGRRTSPNGELPRRRWWR